MVSDSWLEVYLPLPSSLFMMDIYLCGQLVEGSGLL